MGPSVLVEEPDSRALPRSIARSRLHQTLAGLSTRSLARRDWELEIEREPERLFEI
jgi:hypothetical protein